MPLLLSLSTACLLHLPLRRIMHLAAEAGFAGIELVLGPDIWLRGADWVRREAEAAGLGVPSVHQTLLPASPAGWGDGRMLDAVRFAQDLGSPLAVIHGPWSVSWDSGDAQHWLVTLEDCRRAAEGSVRLALENPGVYIPADLSNVLAPLNKLLAFAIDYDLDLTLDTCHVGLGDPSLLETYEALKQRIVNVHFSDIGRGALDGIDVLRAVDSHHQMPGDGELPLGTFVRQLAHDGYGGPLTVEVSLFALRAWSPSRLRRRLAQVCDFVTQAAETAAV